MANIPVTLAVKNLLDSDDNTQFATALGALGAPVETGASIATKLGGASPVANKIGNEYLKDTIEVDYITLTDHSGLVIPAATLGQKGGIAYFGNSPISDFRTIRFINAVTSNGTSGTRTLLGSIAIPASFNTLNTYTALKFIFQITGLNLSSNWAIQIVQAGSTSFEQGTIIIIGAASAKKALIEYDSYTECQAGDVFALRGLVKETISNVDDRDPAVGDKVTLLGLTYAGPQPEPDSFAYNTASTLQIYAIDFSATAADAVIINGQVAVGASL